MVEEKEKDKKTIVRFVFLIFVGDADADLSTPDFLHVLSSFKVTEETFLFLLDCLFHCKKRHSVECM